MSKLINIWKARNLSSLILPQIQFLFSMVQVPDVLFKEIDTILLNYLWGNKPAKIKQSTIIVPIQEGGLNMIDVLAVHTTAKCHWIQRLLIGEQHLILSLKIIEIVNNN